ncbi:refilin-B [Lycaon pictus]|uniref:Refilin B n=2 Tax=Canis lupus familiaris TaxID=9615 RepID=A0A8C0RLD5_CANLF|nr:refilin-B [Canis lupus dingo]XP_038404372.1 refilin-B [Canis lupus familiaris]XP_038533585.1 refilin-B [Canis lupus familiaris]XP_853944.1 refilin-B [Canis lupus familiaris]|eukprot:XP_853944.1 refilin-B [Canis lupus familiaris]
MVGRLSLQDVPELVDTKKKGDGVLDSPDSGLPPSPSPGHWGLAAAGGGGERSAAPGTLEPDAAASPAAPNPAPLPSPLAFACSPRLCPLSFGEGVEFDPLPPTEVRYTSSVKYDSERHFIDDVHLPLGLAVASCSYTVTCLPNCTWRNYKAEVHFKPCHKPTRFLSTTIVYPKYPKTVYTTTLDYNCRKTLRRFLSSVELEATELPGSDGLPDEC